MISKKNINLFEENIGYKFKNKNILISSLIHPSYLKDSSEKKKSEFEEYERLEFLGDRVLGLVIASLIYNKFQTLNEGDLSKKLSYLVQKNFLFKISKELQLEKFLKYSFKKNEKMNVSILADSVEAVIGAIYFDGGINNSTKFIKKIWGKYLNLEASNLQDPKTQLQEISQQKYKKLPVYKLIKKEGPSHSPTFTVSLSVLKFKKLLASGNSIREAEKNVAAIALEKINVSKNS